VMVGGIGAVGGYFAASACSFLLQPEFGWRVMWFLNLPTGLALILLSPLLPESARFLQQMGRGEEARAALARFGAVARLDAKTADALAHESHSMAPPLQRNYLGLTCALTLTAVTWGLVNFGLLVWLPDALVASGRSVATASGLIARSTLIAAPVVVVCVLSYSRWSSKWTLGVMLAIMGAGLCAFAFAEAATLAHPTVPLVAVIVGASGVISIILPYAAETYPLRVRGRATGWVAAASKAGGLAVQAVSVAGLARDVGALALLASVVAAAAFALIVWQGRETRGRDLREVD